MHSERQKRLEAGINYELQITNYEFMEQNEFPKLIINN